MITKEDYVKQVEAERELVEVAKEAFDKAEANFKKAINQLDKMYLMENACYGIGEKVKFMYDNAMRHGKIEEICCDWDGGIYYIIRFRKALNRETKSARIAENMIVGRTIFA